MFWRLWFAVFAITATVIVMFLGLTILQFSQIRAQLETDRLSVLAQRTAAPLEAAAQIGLPLSSVRNLEALIERAAQSDSAITAIHVIGAEGGVLLSTGRGAPGAAWRLPAKSDQAHAPVWSGETEAGFFSGARIASATGAPAGAVVIEYARHESAMRAWAIAAQLGAGGLVLLLATSVAGALALRLGLRREIAAFAAFEREIAEFERDTWRERPESGREPGIETAPGRSLGAMLRAAHAEYCAASRALSAR